MSLLNDVATIQREAQERIAAADTEQALRDLHVAYLGRKGAVTSLLKSLKDLPLDERKQVGNAANACRSAIESLLTAAQRKFVAQSARQSIDPTLPGTTQTIGVVHIINQVMTEVCATFHGMGFERRRTGYRNRLLQLRSAQFSTGSSRS
jgi:phenylalanyl-tRNA synthetase alpha chain